MGLPSPDRSWRWLELPLSLYATIVLLLMWLGFALALALNPAALDELWVWQAQLPIIPRLLAWVLFPPAAVGLWAWQADPSGLVTAVVLIGLVAWTLAALSSLAGAVGRARLRS